MPLAHTGKSAVAAPRTDPDEFAAAVHDAAESLAVLWMKAYDASGLRLSPSQLRALLFVARQGPTNLTRLAEGLGAMLSSASRLCDRLIAAGLVTRTTSPGDRREVLIGLSRDGQRVLESLAAQRQADLAAVLQRMSPRTRDALERGLRAFAAAAVEAGVAGSGAAEARPQVC